MSAPNNPTDPANNSDWYFSSYIRKYARKYWPHRSFADHEDRRQDLAEARLICQQAEDNTDFAYINAYRESWGKSGKSSVREAFTDCEFDESGVYLFQRGNTAPGSKPDSGFYAEGERRTTTVFPRNTFTKPKGQPISIEPSRTLAAFPHPPNPATPEELLMAKRRQEQLEKVSQLHRAILESPQLDPVKKRIYELRMLPLIQGEEAMMKHADIARCLQEEGFGEYREANVRQICKRLLKGVRDGKIAAEQVRRLRAA